MALSLSVTIQRSFRMAEQHGAIADGHWFPGAKDLDEISLGSTAAGAPNTGGLVKIENFQQIPCFSSQTVQDRDIL